MRNFHNILLVIEPETDNDAAIGRAFELATSNGASLSLISVIEEASIFKRAAPSLVQTLVDERTTELQTIAARWAGSASVHVAVGRTFLEVIRYVLQHGHDLVIKSRASGHGRLRSLGATDMHVLRKCPCPVWVVRSEHGGPIRRILAAIDVGPESEEAKALARRVLEIATSLAGDEEGQLDVLHAWSLDYEDTLRSPRSGVPQSEVDRMMANEEQLRTQKLRSLADDVVSIARPGSEGVRSQPCLLIEKGHPSDIIPELVRQSDIELVVMGTVGRTGVPGFFIGNTAEEVLSQIDCSVLAIKPPGFRSPVTIS